MSSARIETSSSKVRAPERWLGAGLVLLVIYLAASSRSRTAVDTSAEAESATVPRQVPAARGAPPIPARASTSTPRDEMSGLRGASGLEPERPPAVAADAPLACPKDMVLVSGSSCPKVEHTCTRWLDDKLLPYARCAEYEQSPRCIGERVPLRFCIDAREHTPAGETLPQNYASFMVASGVCEELGKRICLETEWNFACEGPGLSPYPYGFARNGSCNQDLSDLYEVNPKKQVLRDHRVPSGSREDCKSPFGVYDMVGNLDEPVLIDGQRYAAPHRNGLKGGWWMAGRNRCRPSTTAHSDHYRDIQVGIRCCRDASP